MPVRTWHDWPGLITAALLVLVAGCGVESSPADRVPALHDTLSRIDEAIVGHRYQRARVQLNELVQTTVEARDTDELDPDEADRVLAAAAQLLSLLPEPSPRSEADSDLAPQEDGNEEEEDKEEDEAEKKQEELQKKLEEEQKKLEEERKKDEEGSGNGDSSDNGPDDGEGN